MSEIQAPPDIEPRLSSGAMKLRHRKLNRLPWDHSGKHPGSPIFWNIVRLMIGVGLRYIFRKRELDKIPDFEGGRILSAIHINGLVDPSLMVAAQDRRIISMGRHDLMTMPLIGWVTRRMGSQPVIRKPEIELGVSDEKYAKKINDRTLLTMTNCIAAGYNALVMPEGKSHQDSKLHRFKTGPMRFALNAATLARHKGKSSPALQPVGLHYRCHFWFRTDVFVEFGTPIEVMAPNVEGIGEALSSGEWLEPPSTEVNSLKEELFSALSKITPDAPDWSTYRAWHLIAHVRANKDRKPLTTFKQEVLGARRVRDSVTRLESVDKLMQPSIQAAEILHSNDLDGRALKSLEIVNKRPSIKAIAGIFLMIIASPVSVMSTGLQTLAAVVFAERTDEGVDARTTYYLLAGMFSPVLFWPPIAFATSLLIHPLSFATPFLTVLIMILFHLSNLTFLFGYDLWIDYVFWRKARLLSKSDQGDKLRTLMKEVSSNLNLL